MDLPQNPQNPENYFSIPILNMSRVVSGVNEK